MNPTRQLDSNIKENARALRDEMSPAEKILWTALRGRRFAGLKFRRQHPIGPYVVDFVCPSAKLAVELDGETHLGRENCDVQRQAWLESQGIRVLRFWNTEVFDETESVMEKIWQECAGRCRQET